jgi:hypothetical protein
MLAVYLERIEAAPLGGGELPGQGCVVVAAPVLRLVYVADCVPPPKDDGKPPKAEMIDAWTSTFLADCEAIWNAVADAILGGILGDCSGAEIRPGEMSGPGGGVAEMSIPVRLLSV